MGVIHIIDFSKVSKNPLNPINTVLRQYIYNELLYSINDNTISSIILYGGNYKKNYNFSAGADITEFDSLNHIDTSSNIPSLIDIINIIDTCTTKPIVACIHGICYGGGMEIILACHYRIATTSNTSSNISQTKFALPEIHVGVIPGAGGTQRLSRIIGLQNSLSIILSGRTISVQEAYQLKLLDAIVNIHNDSKDTSNDQLLLEVGKQWAYYGEVVPLHTRRISLRQVPESISQAHVICHIASLSIPQYNVNKNKNQKNNNTLSLSSHEAIIEACRASVISKSFQDGMKKEYELFMYVLHSIEGKARRHIFFATRVAQKKINYMKKLQLQNNSNNNNNTLVLSSSSSVSSVHEQEHVLMKDPKQQIIEIAVIGAGTMGSGIAIVFLQAGYKVYLIDNSLTALEKGKTMIHKVLNTMVNKKKISKTDKEHILQSKLITTQNINDIKNCSLIIEAIIENMTIKQSIFRNINTILKENNNTNCIIVSNTSTLDINTMASVFEIHYQKQFAGLHFFSPAHIMKLIEIIHGNTTSLQTIHILQFLTKKIQKISVVVNNCDGFCGNRMLRPYSAETVLLLVEPVQYKTSSSLSSSINKYRKPPTIEQIDYAIKNTFGMALGPFEMSDLAGNDIGYNIRKERGWVRSNKNEPIPLLRPNRYTELADDMVSQLNRLGQKVNKGWYDYDVKIGKGRKPIPSIEMSNFIQKYQIDSKIDKQSFSSSTNNVETMSDQEIIERVLYPLVNEGFKCLEEQIVYQPSDIDVVYIYGYGFPVQKGGPMFWADNIITLPKLLMKLQEFYMLYPNTDHYEPSQLLIDCVQHNMTLTEYWINKQTKLQHHSNL